LDDAIFTISGGARDSIDGISNAGSFPDDGIAPLAQSGERRPRGVRQPSRRLGQLEDGRAIEPSKQVDHPRQLASFPGDARLIVFVDATWIGDGLRSRARIERRRINWFNRLFAPLVDRDCFQACCRQFER
jgi:hypothetical protein